MTAIPTALEVFALRQLRHQRPGRVQLAAAYDTTYAKAQGSLMADDTELADQPAPEVATVVCW